MVNDRLMVTDALGELDLGSVGQSYSKFLMEVMDDVKGNLWIKCPYSGMVLVKTMTWVDWNYDDLAQLLLCESSHLLFFFFFDQHASYLVQFSHNSSYILTSRLKFILI
ncbi:unnamed protein product [Absidia cylindrospora]